jgi:hypothetical protein
MAKSKCVKEHQKLVNRARLQRVKKPVSKKPTFLREQLGPVSSVKAICQLVEESRNPERWIKYHLPSRKGTVWYARLDPKLDSAAEVDSTVLEDASTPVHKVFALSEGVEEDAEGESDDGCTVHDPEAESFKDESELGTAGTASNADSTVTSRLSSTLENVSENNAAPAISYSAKPGQ